MIAKRIIQESELPKALLARDSNLSRATFNAWYAEGKAARNPTPDSLQQLAAGLRARAAKLENLAAQLESIG